MLHYPALAASGLNRTKVTTTQRTYITFKGVYVAESATYYLCDFYRNASGNFTVVAEVMGRDKKELHFSFDEPAGIWRLEDDLGAPEGLAKALSEQLGRL